MNATLHHLTHPETHPETSSSVGPLPSFFLFVCIVGLAVTAMVTLKRKRAAAGDRYGSPFTCVREGAAQPALCVRVMGCCDLPVRLLRCGETAGSTYRPDGERKPLVSQTPSANSSIAAGGSAYQAA
jgi:hypothetical protein